MNSLCWENQVHVLKYFSKVVNCLIRPGSVMGNKGQLSLEIITIVRFFTKTFLVCHDILTHEKYKNINFVE